MAERARPDARWLPVPGVLHVTAVWRGGGPEPITLRIREDTPASPEDQSRLQLARASADAILTTGRILREEPALSHDLEGDEAEALRRFRRDVAGRDAPPLSAVLTRGRDLDLSHRLFSGETRPVVLTTKVGARVLAEGLASRDIPVRALSAPGARGAVEALLSESGCERVSVEAGPSASRELYEEPCRVDELWLSVFLGDELAPHLRGGAFLSRRAIRASFGAPADSLELEEASGPWRFERYRRRR